MKIRFPKSGHLQATGPVDAIGKYYSPIIGPLLRRRLAWVRDQIDRPVERILEIGYGSGVFQYELSRHCRQSIGIDTHAYAAEVKRRLAEDGIDCWLLRADGGRLPFEDHMFDLVVIVSALEFIPDPVACLRECKRVLGVQRRLVVVTPRKLWWADTLWRLLSGWSAKDDFGDARAKVMRAIETELTGAKILYRPAWLPRFLAPYNVVVWENIQH